MTGNRLRSRGEREYELWRRLERHTGIRMPDKVRRSWMDLIRMERRNRRVEFWFKWGGRAAIAVVLLLWAGTIWRAIA